MTKERRISLAKNYLLWYRLKFDGLDKYPAGPLHMNEISNSIWYYMVNSTCGNYVLGDFTDWLAKTRDNAVLTLAEASLLQ